MSSLNASLDALFSKMDGFVSSKTVIGEPISIGEITVIPLVDVSFGVGAGASDKAGENDKKGEACGGGLGAKITPTAVIIVKNDGIQLVNVRNENSINKLIDLVPGVIDKLSFRKKGSKNLSEEEKKVFSEERINE